MKLLILALLSVVGTAACVPFHQAARTEVARARCVPVQRGAKQDTVVVSGSRPADVGGRRASAAETVVCDGGLAH